MRSFLKAEGNCGPGQRADLTGCTPARPESRLQPPGRTSVPPRTEADRAKDRPPAVPATPEQVSQLTDLVTAANAAASDRDRDYLRLADLRMAALDKLGWNWQQFDAALYAARRRGLLALRMNDGTGEHGPTAMDRNAGFVGEDGELYDRVTPGGS